MLFDLNAHLESSESPILAKSYETIADAIRAGATQIATEIVHRPKTDGGRIGLVRYLGPKGLISSKELPVSSGLLGKGAGNTLEDPLFSLLSLVTRLKILFEIPINERRIPQIGDLGITFDGKEWWLYGATRPRASMEMPEDFQVVIKDTRITRYTR